MAGKDQSKASIEDSRQTTIWKCWTAMEGYKVLLTEKFSINRSRAETFEQDTLLKFNFDFLESRKDYRGRTLCCWKWKLESGRMYIYKINWREATFTCSGMYHFKVVYMSPVCSFMQYRTSMQPLQSHCYFSLQFLFSMRRKFSFVITLPVISI